LKKSSAFWSKVFGLKVGDAVRLKYGKVWWEVYYIGKWGNIGNFIKLRRFLKHRGVIYGETSVRGFKEEECDVVEVSTQEAVEDTFPSQVLR